MRARKLTDINKIVIHCTDSEWGDVTEVTRWHKERGWDTIGYNFLITNGYKTSKSKYLKEFDGLIQEGRDLELVPAHCYGENKSSIGIVLVGCWKFTSAQLMTTLPFLINQLCEKYGISKDNIYCHYQFDEGKTCPNIPIERIKDLL